MLDYCPQKGHWKGRQNTMTKIRRGFFNGVSAAIGGMVLAVNAQSIAFMNVKSFSIPRSDTSYAVQEHVLKQIGLLIMAFGLFLILLTYHEYLRTSIRDD